MDGENKLAISMILAGKGGACVRGEDSVFIPNSVAPHGTVTMMVLNNEGVKNLGTDDPFANLVEQWFGKWNSDLSFSIHNYNNWRRDSSVRGQVPRVIGTASAKWYPHSPFHQMPREERSSAKQYPHGPFH